MHRRSHLAALAILACAPPTVGKPSDGPDLTGTFAGTARTSSEATSLVLEIGQGDGGAVASLTLPDVGVSGWPATSVQFLERGVRVELPSDSGPQVMTLQARENVLEGQWTDRRFEEVATVVLERAPARRPLEERLVIDGPAGKLGALILTPEGAGPFPAVVFLHGSGPQPRDASRFAAETMAGRGVMAVIFDKRGVGDSEGDLAGASFEDLAADGVAVAEYVRGRPDVSRVGFFGHSQGGWIGPLAAATWKDAAFVIASAGPAVSPAREGQWTAVRALRRANAGAEAVAEARRVIELWHEGVRTRDWSAFDAALEAARREPWFPDSGLDEFAERPNEEFARSYAVFMNYDPLPALHALRAPMLAMLSPDDESIDAVETAGILRQLVDDGADIRIELYPGYDHSMRRLGPAGAVLRWPEHPSDYFAIQVEFIRASLSTPPM
jgi:dienelactone hydrolase